MEKENTHLPTRTGCLICLHTCATDITRLKKVMKTPILCNIPFPSLRLPSHVSPACFKPFKSYHTHKYLKFPCLLPLPSSVLSPASTRRKLKSRKQIPPGLSSAPTLLAPSTQDSFSSIRHLHAEHTAIWGFIL